MIDSRYHFQVNRICKELELSLVEMHPQVRPSVIALDVAEVYARKNWGNPGSLRGLIDEVLVSIGLNPSRLTDLRLEHKLLQALVLDSVGVEGIPKVYGAGDLYAQLGKDRFRNKLREVFPEGFCVKRAVYYGSSVKCTTEETEDEISGFLSDANVEAPPPELLDENWIIQEHVRIAYEYKIHTLEGKVIPGLTCRYNNSDRDKNFHAAETFVQNNLERLPAWLKRDAMCAWDVALSQEGEYRIIEVNYAGFHKKITPGFHCSGIFQDGPKAPLAIAILLIHIERQFNVTFMLSNEAPLDSHFRQYFDRIILWHRLLGVRADVESLVQRTLGDNREEELKTAMLNAKDAVERAYISALLRLSREVSCLPCMTTI